jgi:hypothetical protein
MALRHTDGGSGFGADTGRVRGNNLVVHGHALRTKIEQTKGDGDRLMQWAYMMSIANKPRSDQVEHTFFTTSIQDLKLEHLRKEGRGCLSSLIPVGSLVAAADPIRDGSEMRMTQLITPALQGEAYFRRDWDKLRVSPGHTVGYAIAVNFTGFVKDPTGQNFGKALVYGQQVSPEYAQVHSMAQFAWCSSLPLSNLDRSDPKTFLPLDAEIRGKLETYFSPIGQQQEGYQVKQSSLTRLQREHNEWVELTGGSDLAIAKIDGGGKGKRFKKEVTGKDDQLTKFVTDKKFHFNPITTTILIIAAGRIIEPYMNHYSTDSLCEIYKPTAFPSMPGMNAPGHVKLDIRHANSMWSTLVLHDQGRYMHGFIAPGQPFAEIHGGLCTALTSREHRRAIPRLPEKPMEVDIEAHKRTYDEGPGKDVEPGTAPDGALFRGQFQPFVGLPFPPAEMFAWGLVFTGESLEDEEKVDVANITASLKALISKDMELNYQFLFARALAPFIRLCVSGKPDDYAKLLQKRGETLTDRLRSYEKAMGYDFYTEFLTALEHQADWINPAFIDDLDAILLDKKLQPPKELKEPLKHGHGKNGKPFGNTAQEIRDALGELQLFPEKIQKEPKENVAAIEKAHKDCPSNATAALEALVKEMNQAREAEVKLTAICDQIYQTWIAWGAFYKPIAERVSSPPSEDEMAKNKEFHAKGVELMKSAEKEAKIIETAKVQALAALERGKEEAKKKKDGSEETLFYIITDLEPREVTDFFDNFSSSVNGQFVDESGKNLSQIFTSSFIDECKAKTHSPRDPRKYFLASRGYVSPSTDRKIDVAKMRARYQELADAHEEMDEASRAKDPFTNEDAYVAALLEALTKIQAKHEKAAIYFSPRTEFQFLFELGVGNKRTPLAGGCVPKEVEV